MIQELIVTDQLFFTSDATCVTQLQGDESAGVADGENGRNVVTAK